jgi:hypothetical protein
MKIGVRKRAYNLGVQLTNGDSVIPMSWTVDTSNLHLMRHLVRLKRISRGLKPFKRPDNPNISIYGCPWESEWYLKYVGCAK